MTAFVYSYEHTNRLFYIFYVYFQKRGFLEKTTYVLFLYKLIITSKLNDMKKTKNLIISLACLIMGVLIGYSYSRVSTTHDTKHTENHQMVHNDHTLNGNVTAEKKSMAQMMHDMNQELIGKSGDAFDQAFLNEMIIHHQGAVEMAKLVLNNSKRPELLRLASEIIETQTTEINQMEIWHNNWFKN